MDGEERFGVASLNQQRVSHLAVASLARFQRSPLSCSSKYERQSCCATPQSRFA